MRVRGEGRPLTRYAVALAATSVAGLARWALDGWLGGELPYITYYAAVALSAWFGGFGPGFFSLALSGASAAAFTLAPRGSLFVARPADLVGLAVFAFVGSIVVAIGGQNRRATRRAEAAADESARQREWLRVTLRSIGDAVIATDGHALVTFMNGVAESMTGWPAAEAQGRPLAEVFVIVNKHTRLAAEDPAASVLRDGRVVGLANHTVLIGRDGTERPIADSAAPIRGDDGNVDGVVIVFRDVTAERQARLAVSESETRYRLLAESLGVIVWTNRPDGRVDYLNRHWVEYTGLSLEEASGGDWGRVVHPDDVAEIAAEWGRAREAKERFEFEYRLLRASDGSYRGHFARVHPVLDGEGRVLHWLGTAIDVEDRKRAAAALRAGDERLRLALDAGRMGTWDYDVAAGTVAGSPGLERIHGIPVGSFPGTFEAYESDIHPDDRERVLASIKRAIGHGHQHQAEYRIVWPDGSIHWIEARGKPLADESGEVTRLLGICADITETKRIEGELRSALALAEEAGRARDQFLAMLSHELRTPLGPVLLAADELLADAGLGDDRRELVAAVRQNVELEVRLIDDLLDVMRIVRGKLPFRFETADLHELIRRTIDICRSDASAKSLALTFDPGAARRHVRADPARLQQVLWNLVKNAVKFTPEGGSVRVRTWDEGPGGRVVVEVKDTGIGIDPEALSRVFNAFEQAEDSVTARYGGLGLGLAISKSIVEAHGGSLSAWSEGKDTGTTLRFTLEAVAPAEARSAPAAPAAAGAAGAEAPPEPLDATGLRLLLVEDDPMTARIMTRLLRQNGYDVITANTIAAALEIPAGEFDLIVSDLGLPDGSGLDLLRRLSPRGEIPAIALTGYGREDDVRRSREAGFVAHLTKPVDFARLDAMIRRVAAEFESESRVALAGAPTRAGDGLS